MNITRTIATLSLAGLILAPGIASAQSTPSSPKPAASGMKSTSSSMASTTKKKSTHAKKAGQAQSTTPGTPTYSGSSSTGNNGK